MGPQLRNKVNDVEKRFKEDWNEVQRVWKQSRTELDDDVFGFFDFLLGWLNGQSRRFPLSLSLSIRSQLTRI
jgi:hypothetical protein